MEGFAVTLAVADAIAVLLQGGPSVSLQIVDLFLNVLSGQSLSILKGAIIPEAFKEIFLRSVTKEKYPSCIRVSDLKSTGRNV